MSAPVYSTAQVEAWLERIDLPKDFRPVHEPGKDLEALTRIQKHSLSEIPFEDLELHYSEQHAVSLDLQHVFDRAVVRRLGGYCMQGNALLEHMLRALGFRLYSTGARSRRRVNGIPSGPYTGWTHQVLIVTLADGFKYMVDVTYGGDCPITPIKLKEGTTIENIGSTNRVVQQALGYDKCQLTWVYQVRFTPDGEWYGAVTFNEMEFLPQDFVVMSHWASTSPQSWIGATVVGVKFIREGEELVGKYTIAHDVVRRNLRGKLDIMIECKNEAERVDALKKYFGIELIQKEIDAMRGWKAEIKSA